MAQSKVNDIDCDDTYDPDGIHTVTSLSSMYAALNTSQCPLSDDSLSLKEASECSLSNDLLTLKIEIKSNCGI